MRRNADKPPPLSALLYIYPCFLWKYRHVFSTTHVYVYGGATTVVYVTTRKSGADEPVCLVEGPRL